MNELKLEDLISIEDDEKVRQMLHRPDYRSFVRVLRGSNGRYQFRIHDETSSVIARSREFDEKADRDRLLAEFIRFVEVELNGRLQMSLF